MKTIEMTVRFNISIPDDTKIDNLFLNIDLYKDGISKDIAILSSVTQRKSTQYRINEYETLSVEEIKY